LVSRDLPAAIINAIELPEREVFSSRVVTCFTRVIEHWPTCVGKVASRPVVATGTDGDDTVISNVVEMVGIEAKGGRGLAGDMFGTPRSLASASDRRLVRGSTQASAGIRYCDCMQKI
jgi:hypothetical protein